MHMLQRVHVDVNIYNNRLQFLLLFLHAGQGSSGSRVYSAMNVTLGELVVVCEWSLSANQGGARQTLITNDNQKQDLQGRLVKQV